MHKGIITVAIGQKYAIQAKYLAYSCMINSPNTLRAVITDLPEYLNYFYDIIIPFTKNDDPFSLKTRLFEFTPFQKTLYLDADSLVYHPIEEYWNILGDNSYIYEGKKAINGEWYYNIESVLKKLNLEWIPIFNSGMILFNKDSISKSIFETAFYYFINHKNEGIDIPYFRGTNYPDEPVFAISLSKHKIEPINDYGRFSRTLIRAKKIKLHILKRIARYIKDDKMRHPLVVHFCGRKGNLYYLREKIRLFIHFHI